MKPLFCVTLAGLLLGGAAVAAARPADHGPDVSDVKHQRARADRDNVHVSAGVYFSTGDARVIREYYAPRYRSLPPGLQKKVQRGRPLPPGWQKKLQPFPVVLERELVALPQGYYRGVIDGHAVVYNPRTQVVFDVLVLF